MGIDRSAPLWADRAGEAGSWREVQDVSLQYGVCGAGRTWNGKDYNPVILATLGKSKAKVSAFLEGLANSML